MNNNYNSNTVVKQDFAVVKQVDGRAARMTDTTRHQSWQSTPLPLPDHAGSIPGCVSSRIVLMGLYVLFVSEEDIAAEATLVQPKFIPTGPIKNPVARGKPQL